MQLTLQQMADACRSYAPLITNAPVCPVSILWTLAGNESSFGENCTPRHEPSWDRGGVNYQNSEIQKALWAREGSAASYSYGPWQLMYFNFVQPCTIKDAAENLHIQAVSTCVFLTNLIRRWNLKTLVDIGVCWNHGSPTRNISPGVQAYVHELAYNLQVKLPKPIQEINQCTASTSTLSQKSSAA